ncbi:MAG: hypothetical protein MSC30_05435 [Gaiellaceae bacterium MAG52_C11]|nr:hypothetical protein [Candidatus Gaiellasilicea maunaloa]
MPIVIDDSSGNIFAGGGGSDGDLLLRGTDESDRVHLDAGAANAWLGGNGQSGDLVVFAAGGDNETAAQATVHLQGSGGNIFAGGSGTDGDLVLRADDGTDRIRLDAGQGNAWLGGNGADGDLVLFSATGDNATLAQATIHLNGSAGDITLSNADCAEDFEFDDAVGVDPGTVVEIGDDARLRVARGSYSRRVAGIVAGAGNLRPGIVLGRTGGVGQLPVALVGKAYCKADASFAAIQVGDLLTTSATPGHAMKASDPARAFGAVLGKSLGALHSGTGLLPVLIALQ